MTGVERYPDLIGSGISFEGIYKTGDLIFFTLLAVAVYAALAGLYWISRRRKDAPERSHSKFNSFSERVSAAIVLFFAPIALGSLLGVLGAPAVDRASSVIQAIWFMASALIAWRVPPGRILRSCGPLLPLLLLRLRGITFSHPQGAATTGLTPLALGGLVALVGLLIYRAYRRWRISPQASIGWVEIASLCAFYGFRYPKVPALALDDYHAGEMLLPFDQFFAHGQAMYADFVSVHGWLAVTYGAVHRFLTDGTYASFPFACSLTHALFAGLFGALCARWIGGTLALAIAFLAVSSLDRFELVPFFLLMVAAVPRPSLPLWTAFTFVFLPFAAFFNPASGMAMILASVPWQVSQFLGDSAKGRQKRATLSAVFVVLLILLFHRPLWGLWAFLAQNGPGTVQAFGLSMHNPHSLPSVLQGKLTGQIAETLAAAFKALKLYGWLAGVALIASFLIQKKRRINLAVVSVLSLPVFLIPYSYGRIGTDGLDRAGNVSILMLGLAIPLIVAADRRRWRGAWGIFGIGLVILGAGWRGFAHLKDFRSPFAQAQGSVTLDPSLVPLRREDFGIPRLGHTFGDASRVAELQAWGEAMRRFPEAAKEGWLDLTNRQVHFWILGAPVRQVYPSHLLAITEPLQMRMIQGLRARPVHLAWIGRTIDYESARTPLRSYRLYRWLLEESKFRELVTIGPSLFLRPGDGPWRPSALARLDALWHTGNLERLPASWGASWSTLTSRFLVIRAQNLTTTDKTIFAPERYDFLLLEGRSTGGAGHCDLLAADTTSRYPAYRFSTPDENSRHLLIPTGSSPTWLIHPPRDLALKCTSFTPTSATFLRLTR